MHMTSFVFGFMSLAIDLHTFIFDDPGMRENDMAAIVKRVESVFQDKTYMKRVDKSDKRWMDDEISNVFEGIVNYLKGFV